MLFSSVVMLPPVAYPLGFVRTLVGFTFTMSRGIPSVLAATCATWKGGGGREREEDEERERGRRKGERKREKERERERERERGRE